MAHKSDLKSIKYKVLPVWAKFKIIRGERTLPNRQVGNEK
jgi:hypothetical protein